MTMPGDFRPAASSTLCVVNCLGDGPIPYYAAWERQKDKVAKRQAGEIPDTLLLLEHPPTVTYGKAAKPAYRLLSEADYAARGIELVATDRGGDVTYHGPGQLVGYPILHLGEGRRDLHRYVRFLEAVIIATAADFGVTAHRADWHAGVWVGDGYLAALGVKVARWVTHHGFALNVTEAVKPHFATIVPCGVEGKRIITLEEAASTPLTVTEVAEQLAYRFVELYQREFGLPVSVWETSASASA